jgi:nickel-dependent lactate racemase
VEVAAGRLIAVQPPPIAPSLADPAAAVRAALEHPRDFPALRRALTPDDHVAIAVDEHLPDLAALLTPLLEHVGSAGVAPEAITLICPPSLSKQAWLEGVPDAFQEVRLEVHDPHDRKKLSYLATTRQGRRIYLNRTIVDADQLIVLCRRGYDVQLGYGGAEGTIFPALADESTRQEFAAELSLGVPGGDPWPLQSEAREVVWLLGTPFLVQAIEGAGDDLCHIAAGLMDGTSGEGQELLDARWRIQVARPADIVVAAVAGNPERHDFAELARALTCAARVVQPRGRILLLTQSCPVLEAGAELLTHAEDPDQALALLHRKKPPDMTAAFEWASAAQQAQLYLLSELPAETVEGLFAIPLENAAEVQRLLAGEGSCLLLNDANKSLALVDEGAHA